MNHEQKDGFPAKDRPHLANLLTKRAIDEARDPVFINSAQVIIREEELQLKVDFGARTVTPVKN
jgi:hypothetical protein